MLGRDGTAPAQTPVADGNIRAGEALLAAAWAALTARRIDAVDIHLRSGPVIVAALAVRIDGPVGEASTRHGEWSHGFALADVCMVRHVPRGGLTPGSAD
jgi:hypothetical protein